MAGNSKITYNGEVLIDISNDSVTPQTLAKGVTAHDSNGEQIIGTMVPEGGGGSGIIDVTELPISNIDENAVYRVTESYKASSVDICAVTPDEETGEMMVGSLVAELSAVAHINIYSVDELPSDMKGSDIENFTELNIYITSGDGIAYVYIPAYEMTATVGLILFGEEGFDKGSTDDVYAETEMGVYTTTERYNTFQRWFIRESGEWKEITAYTRQTVVGDVNNIKVLSGVYTITDGIEITQNGVDINVSDMLIDDKGVPSTIRVNMPSTGDLIQGSVNEITEGYFRSSDGSYINSIDRYAFYYKNIEKVELPEGISYINGYAFANCVRLQQIQIPKSVEEIKLDCFSYSGLRSVTFKGTPSIIDPNAFYYCFNLTTINVPWSENKVENAPWGATNATINYNYTGG